MGIDHGFPEPHKKSLTDAAREAARSGEFRHPLHIQVAKARQINQALGGAFVAPWEVAEMPDEYLYAIESMIEEYPAAKRENDVIEAKLAEWRRSHPTYRK